ncbi:RHS repeat domain-containing protein [Pseudomonas laurylsulfatiphila]|uniref:RHS repeat domain-containing protein n=1 Tax=Pseudomonas laurylsulfatiphila TaxID=2011015 RepID=UPI003D2077E2|nr:insecticidal toxin complex protein TccC [Pseudomonas reinekei]
MNTSHHAATPTLSVIDPRALTICSVGYCRLPDSPMIDPRITRQRFDAAGRLIESWDPRLWGTVPKPNLVTVYGLSGQPLLTDSVDAGWQLSLPDQVGSPCSFWDARGSQRHTRFDEQQRPISVTEQALGELPRVVERLTYGDCGPAFAERNQCGQLIRHDDPAGVQTFPDYGLGGAVLVEDRRFLADLDTPDWPLDIEERETWLEAQSFITRHTFNPGGELQRQIDAMGNVRTFGYDVAGKLSGAWLQMADSGKPPQCLVSDIRYNAQDQVEIETAGNGVLTRVQYAADDGRLLRLQVALGSQKPLQDLNYVYDPVGNIVELHDRSQPVTYFNNQRIDPINRYRYDSLYQLVEARGWEVSQPSHGPTLPELLPTPLDPNQRRNYTQQFEYDRGGNLITRLHSGAPGFSMFTSARSNRSLAQHGDGSLPGESDIDSGFDAGGNQRELQRGQAMTWDLRNQLSRVTLVQRETEPDDYESYRYDRPGHRLRKVGFTQSSARTLRTEVRYLPGLEIHHQADGEEHHVISVEAGRSNVRALHWPQGAHSDQLRYSLSDHLGSSTMELEDDAGVLTQEHYYPFGGTACWAGKSALVAKYKTTRYSGKELDATGLYYYGYRYYAPWLRRWISADPSGSLDGLNLYVFCGNNAINYRDALGLVKYKGKGDKLEKTRERWGSEIVARGLSEIKRVDAEKGERLEAALRYVQIATGEAIRVLQEDNVDTVYRDFTSRIFGTFAKPEELRRALLKILIPLKKTADKYAGDRAEQLVWSTKSEMLPSVASTHPEDKEKRIFLSGDALDKSPVELMTIIVHESSHRLKKPTWDFVYYAADRVLKPDDVNKTDSIVDVISSGLQNSSIGESSMKHIIAERREKYFGKADAVGIERQLNDSSELLNRVLLSNADSIAILVKSLAYPLVR